MPKDKNMEFRRRYATGSMGVHYVQMELDKLDIDSIPIDRTYDLFLWERNHRVEVKTSHKHLKPGGQHEFTFDEAQCKKDAFDYAVCIGLNVPEDSKECKEVEVMYIIPQKYIYHRACNGSSGLTTQLRILRSASLHGYKLMNSYVKYNMCRLSLDIFTNKNKASFTRKKNALAKRLINYNIDSLDNFCDAFKEHFGNGGSSKEAEEMFDIGRNTVSRYRKKLDITSYAKRKGDARLTKQEGLDALHTPKIIKLWKKGHTRNEIREILKISQRRMQRISKDIALPSHNPYRNRTRKK